MAFRKDRRKGPNSICFARVSTTAQNIEQQFSVLTEAGCDLTFGEKVSSTVAAEKRPERQRVLAALKQGDTLVVSNW